MMTASGTTHQKERLLFVVSAPSGTGKTSLCSRAVGEVSNLGFSISHTTRAPRLGEKQGQNYHFVSHKTFREYVAGNEMAEWTEIYGNCYGTAKETIQKEFEKGRDILFDIDERGARQLLKAYPALVTVLVLPPSLDALKKRLADRATDDEQTIRKRLKKAREEINNMSWYKYVVVNDDFDEALSDLKAVITAERCKNSHGFIEVLLNG